MEYKQSSIKANSLKKIEKDMEIESNANSNKSYDEKNSQSEDSIISNNATCSSGCISNSSFHSTQNINIKIYYYINKELKNTEIVIQEDKTIKDLICFSLNIINEELISNKLNIQLDTSNYKKYCIILVKNKEEIKNFKEANKVPSLSPESLIVSYSNSDNLYYLKWLDTKNNNIIPYQRIKNNKREFNSFKKNNIIKLDISENQNKIKNGDIIDDDINCIIF